MERFQVERSTRRKTTAFLPSWGGIPSRQHPGGRQPVARAVRPHRPRGSDRRLPGARAEGASRASTARGRPAGRGGAGARRLASPERSPGAGERARFSVPAFLSAFRGAPGVEVGLERLPASSLDGPQQGGRGWFGRNQGQRSESAAGWEVETLADEMTWLQILSLRLIKFMRPWAS